ncbi:MAG: hypothetical protein V3V70_04300 [Candidatus Scalindua sp.]
MRKLVFCIVVVLFAAIFCLDNEGIGNESIGNESIGNESMKSEGTGNESMESKGTEDESMKSENTENKSTGSKSTENESRYKFQFVSDYIRSLSRLKMIEKETRAFNRQHENDIQYRDATVIYFRRANKELFEAREMISKYENSEDQLIKSAAEAVLLLYDNLSEIQLETVKMFEGLDNPEQFNIESFMEKSNELQLRRDKFLKAFNDTAIIVTYVLVSWEPDESGRLSYLAISRNQRGSLIKQLGDTFGVEEGSEIQDGQTYLNSCGAVLLKVLIGEHKSSDER